MVMPPCGTFDYFATVTGARSSQQRTWTFGATLRQQVTPRGDKLVDGRLVGYSPLVELSRGKVALRARHRANAQVLTASFDVHCGLMSALRCHDRLHLVRSSTGDLAVSVVRDGRLVLAFGALTLLTLGKNVSVRPSRSAHAELDGELGFPPHHAAGRGWQLWDRRAAVADVYIDGATKTLAVGERVDLMGYHVWVGRGRELACAGALESLAVSDDAACPAEVAVESARLVARVGALGLVSWPD